LDYEASKLVVADVEYFDLQAKFDALIHKKNATLSFKKSLMSFSHQIVIVLVWVIIPIFNFSVWFYIGAKSSSSLPCPEASTPIVEITADNDCPVGTFQNPSCYNFIEPKYKNPHLSMISTRTFDSYRAKTLATMNYPGNSQTLILKG
jgi:hypothetical protein